MWLEVDLLDKSDKLKSCYTYITVLRKERDESNQMLEQAKKFSVEAKESLTVLTKERDDALAAKVEADKKVELGVLKIEELKDNDLHTAKRGRRLEV